MCAAWTAARQAVEWLSKVLLGCHWFLEPSWPQCIPQLLEGAWERIYRVNTTLKVVPQMLNSVQVWVIRGPGQYLVLVMLFQTMSDISYCVTFSSSCWKIPSAPGRTVSMYGCKWTARMDSHLSQLTVPYTWMSGPRECHKNVNGIRKLCTAAIKSRKWS